MVPVGEARRSGCRVLVVTKPKRETLIDQNQLNSEKNALSILNEMMNTPNGKKSTQDNQFVHEIENFIKKKINNDNNMQQQMTQTNAQGSNAASNSMVDDAQSGQEPSTPQAWAGQITGITPDQLRELQVRDSDKLVEFTAKLVDMVKSNEQTTKTTQAQFEELQKQYDQEVAKNKQADQTTRETLQSQLNALREKIAKKLFNLNFSTHEGENITPEQQQALMDTCKSQVLGVLPDQTTAAEAQKSISGANNWHTILSGVSAASRAGSQRVREASRYMRQHRQQNNKNPIDALLALPDHMKDSGTTAPTSGPLSSTSSRFESPSPAGNSGQRSAAPAAPPVDDMTQEFYRLLQSGNLNGNPSTIMNLSRQADADLKARAAARANQSPFN